MRVLGQPGSNFLYNPIVYGRLSNWVEEQTGEPFATWVRRYVIDKAGLKDVAAGWRDPKGGDALRMLAPPFRHSPEHSDNLEPSALPNPEMNGSSGIIASAHSLAEYSIALDEGRILEPDLLEEMWTPPTEADGSSASYAYGWWSQEWNGKHLVWHGGWWPEAYAGFLLKVPGDDLSLVVFGNTDGLHWGNRLQVAEIEKSPLALKFLNLFVGRNDCKRVVSRMSGFKAGLAVSRISAHGPKLADHRMCKPAWKRSIRDAERPLPRLDFRSLR